MDLSCQIQIWWLGSKTNPAAARLGTRQSLPKLVLWGSFRPGLGSGVVGTLRMLHLGQKRGTAGLCSPGMTAAAALRGGAHRRSMFGPNQGWSRGAKCVQGLCAAQVNPYEGRAGLCWAAASSPWRGCGAGGGEAPVTGVPVPIVCHWP